MYCLSKLEDMLNKSHDVIDEVHGEHNRSLEELISKTRKVFRNEKELKKKRDEFQTMKLERQKVKFYGSWSIGQGKIWLRFNVNQVLFFQRVPNQKFGKFVLRHTVCIVEIVSPYPDLLIEVKYMKLNKKLSTSASKMFIVCLEVIYDKDYLVYTELCMIKKRRKNFTVLLIT